MYAVGRQKMHRIDKERPSAESRKLPTTGAGPPTSLTLLLPQPPITLPLPPQIPSKSPPNFPSGGLCPHPALSAPFRIWVRVWVSPHPGGEGQQANTVFSSITNKNQPDLERSELIFCWILPTTLAGKGFEPHDLRVMRWYQKYYSEQYGRL